MTDDELDAQLREAIDSEPLHTSRLERSIRAQMHRPRWIRHGATAAIAAAILLTIAIRRVPPAFHQAARDHRLEVVEHRPRRWQTTSPGGPDLAPAGYRLEHSKICQLEGKPVLHLVYTDGAHEVSVYLDSAVGGGDADVDGEHVTAFRTNRERGLVVGTQSECRQFAAAIQKLT